MNNQTAKAVSYALQEAKDNLFFTEKNIKGFYEALAREEKKAENLKASIAQYQDDLRNAGYVECRKS